MMGGRASRPPFSVTTRQKEGGRLARQTTRDHKGWYVPRALPHLDAAETVQAITFRLADSLPRAVAMARKDEGDVSHRHRIAAALDAGHGACLLRDPAIAGVVEAALLNGEGTRYELFAWVVMPNHVHALIRQQEGHRLSDTMHAWKSWTAKQINHYLNRRGTVWQREYFDRYVRNELQFAATVFYIEENPVKAGFVATAAEWRFGSGWWRENGRSAESS